MLYQFSTHCNAKPIVTEFKKMSDYVETDCEIITSHKTKGKNGRPTLWNHSTKRMENTARIFYKQLIFINFIIINTRF